MAASIHILFTVKLNFVRYFNKPTPSVNVVLAEVARLRVAVCKSLNNPLSRQKITLEFRQDVFTYLITGRGRKHGLWFLLEEEDFEKRFFPDNWDNLLDKHDQGTRVNFPVKVRHFISWSLPQFSVDISGNVVPSSRSYLEKMSMDFIKVAA